MVIGPVAGGFDGCRSGGWLAGGAGAAGFAGSDGAAGADGIGLPEGLGDVGTDGPALQAARTVAATSAVAKRSLDMSVTPPDGVQG
jgi:hypothetical protein